MKLSSALAVLLLSTAFCFAQTPSPTPELTEKELEAQIRNAIEEGHRILLKPQVLYYSPAIDPTGTRIGYVKRTVEYRLKGGGLIPFLSDAPELTWISDMIEVCERDLASGSERIIAKWVLPRPADAREVGTVFPEVAWSKKNKLHYDINLTKYEEREFPEGNPCRGSGICLSNEFLPKEEQRSAIGMTVTMDMDPARHRYPVSNKIVITCDEKVVSCPKF